MSGRRTSDVQHSVHPCHRQQPGKRRPDLVEHKSATGRGDASVGGDQQSEGDGVHRRDARHVKTQLGQPAVKGRVHRRLQSGPHLTDRTHVDDAGQP
jgi:hypothetical protein